MERKSMSIYEFKTYCDAHNMERVIYSTENNQPLNGMQLRIAFEKISVYEYTDAIVLTSQCNVFPKPDVLTFSGVQEIIVEPSGCWDVVSVICRSKRRLYTHVLLIDYPTNK